MRFCDSVEISELLFDTFGRISTKLSTEWEFVMIALSGMVFMLPWVSLLLPVITEVWAKVCTAASVTGQLVHFTGKELGYDLECKYEMLIQDHVDRGTARDGKMATDRVFSDIWQPGEWFKALGVEASW
jgi:hypothetical protein